LQTMAQQSRQTSISEIQQLNEEIFNQQGALAALKNTEKKDFSELKEFLNEFQQRERKRQQDKDTEDGDYRTEVYRRLQTVDTRLTETDTTSVVSALKDAVSKLILWQSEMTAGVEQQQRSVVIAVESLRKVRDIRDDFCTLSLLV
jgi:vacuolar-type H+-ATPase subunit I/STV1